MEYVRENKTSNWIESEMKNFFILKKFLKGSIFSVVRTRYILYSSISCITPTDLPVSQFYRTIDDPGSSKLRFLGSKELPTEQQKLLYPVGRN